MLSMYITYSHPHPEKALEAVHSQCIFTAIAASSSTKIYPKPVTL